jgi:hypothetical protein
MMRVVVGIAAWVTGTAIAVCVAWFGANVVLADAGVGQGVPVVNAAPPPATATAAVPAVAETAAASTSPSPRPSASSTTVTRPPAAAGSTTRSPAATPKASPASSPSPTPAAGTVHAYTLTGGHVTLDMTATSVQLVSAVPDAGYAVQTWTGTDWLRVDFSSGAQVSSLIASWYQHAPTVTVEN